MRRSPLIRTYAGLVLVPAAFATGCSGDDASQITDSTDSSGSSSDDPTSTSQSTTTTMSTGATETSGSTTLSPDSSGDEASTESGTSTSSATGSSSSESSSTGVDNCGNDMIDPGEDCDGEDLGGSDCTDVGFDSGTLACHSGCGFDTFNCIIYICGNNSIDPSEFCDGNDLPGGDCVSEGFPLGGELECNSACDDYDISGCLTHVCGNDTIEETETCDGSDLGGTSCASLGFAGGQLDCATSCLGYVTTGCSGGGDQFAYVLNDMAPESISAYSVDSDGVLTELTGSPFATGGDGGFDHRPDALVNCGPYLYAANDTTGDISGFFVAADGTLTAVPNSPFALPGAVSLACNGGHLFATTFGAIVERFAIEDDGSLTDLGSVATSPSALGVTLDPETSRLVVAGVSTTIDVFDVDVAGNLTAVPDSPFVHGGGNRSASIGPHGTFVASEANGGVRVWSVAGDGALSEVPGSPFADTSGCEVVGLAWAPDGERLFVGHRGCAPGRISVYDVAGNGALTQVVGSPFLSGDDETVGLAVDPSGSRLFATHLSGDSTSVLDVSDGGTLTPVAGSPFPNGVAGSHPWLVLRGGSAVACQTPFGAPSYDAAETFPDAPLLEQTRMTMAWDGVDYWESSGGSNNGNRLAQIDAMGAVVSYQQPGLDLRSAFTKGDGVGPVFLREYSNPQIYVQSSPGVYDTDVVLVGGFLDSQAAVVWDDYNDYFLSHIAGTVSRWDETGALVDTIELDGYGTMGTEQFGIENRGLAWSCGYFYTYSAQVLSAWDETGTRVATTTLNGAGVSGDSYYAYSAANGMFWVVDFVGGTWRGYDAI